MAKKRMYDVELRAAAAAAGWGSTLRFAVVMLAVGVARGATLIAAVVLGLL